MARVQQFNYRYEEKGSGSFQSASAALEVTVLLEEGNDFDEEFKKVRSDIYSKVHQTVAKGLEKLIEENANLAGR